LGNISYNRKILFVLIPAGLLWPGLFHPLWVESLEAIIGSAKSDLKRSYSILAITP
jgi:hypothetical protein